VLFAALVAVLHGAAVLFMLGGSLLALRWPRSLWLHVPVSLAILGLYLTGSDCPLTTWELELRAAAGEPGYRGGFVGHYLTEPLGFPIEARSTQVGIYVLAFLPNLIGYGLLAVRSLRYRNRLLRADADSGESCWLVGGQVGGAELEPRASRRSGNRWEVQKDAGRPR
jgi:hypothetical protein